MSSRISAMLLLSMIVAGIGLSPASAQPLTNKAERDEIVLVAESDPGLAAAMRKARDTLPEFLKAANARKPGAEGFAVKVAIREGNKAEYFWILPFEPKGDAFTGKLNNTPRMVKGVKNGDTLNFSKSEIVDWMYMDQGAMKGNYTACALLKKGAQKDRDAFRKRFGLDCDA